MMTREMAALVIQRVGAAHRRYYTDLTRSRMLAQVRAERVKEARITLRLFGGGRGYVKYWWYVESNSAAPVSLASHRESVQPQNGWMHTIPGKRLCRPGLLAASSVEQPPGAGCALGAARLAMNQDAREFQLVIGRKLSKDEVRNALSRTRVGRPPDITGGYVVLASPFRALSPMIRVDAR